MQTWLGAANAGVYIESRVKLHLLDTESARRRRAALRAADIEHRALCRHRESCWISNRRPRRRRELRWHCRAPRGSLCGPKGESLRVAPFLARRLALVAWHDDCSPTWSERSSRLVEMPDDRTARTCRIEQRVDDVAALQREYSLAFVDRHPRPNDLVVVVEGEFEPAPVT
jgi:hypothetical protein